MKHGTVFLQEFKIILNKLSLNTTYTVMYVLDLNLKSTLYLSFRLFKMWYEQCKLLSQNEKFESFYLTYLGCRDIISFFHGRNAICMLWIALEPWKHAHWIHFISSKQIWICFTFVIDRSNFVYKFCNIWYWNCCQLQILLQHVI